MAKRKLTKGAHHHQYSGGLHRSTLLHILSILIALALTGAAFAQAGNPAIDWWTVASGGGNSSGDKYTLSDTIGQPLAGGAISSGEYVLLPGYWTGNPAQYNLYLPLLIR